MKVKLESKVINSGDRFEATVENGNVILIPIEDELIPKDGDWLVFEEKPNCWSSSQGECPFDKIDYPYTFKASNVEDVRNDEGHYADFTMIDKLGYGHAYCKGDKLRLATKEEIEKVEPSVFKAGQVWSCGDLYTFCIVKDCNDNLISVSIDSGSLSDRNPLTNKTINYTFKGWIWDLLKDAE